MLNYNKLKYLEKIKDIGDFSSIFTLLLDVWYFCVVNVGNVCVEKLTFCCRRKIMDMSPWIS